MTEEKMTIHEALAELKVLSKRIEKEIAGTTFVDTYIHYNPSINGKSVEEYGKDITSAYQKITDLIKRREAIKKAVTQSNAETKVNIAGKEMTVAEAIEYKNSGILYKEALLNTMVMQYNRVKNKMISENGPSLSERADRHVVSLYGSEKKESVDPQTAANTKADYIRTNTVEIINPLEIEKKIEELKDEIDRFKVKVDAELSNSNATTIINVNY